MNRPTLEYWLNVPRYTWRFVSHLVERYVEDRCQATAAALTYQTLFAVVPLLTVMYAIFNAFEAFSGLSDMVEGFVFDNVVPENVVVLQDYLRDFSTQARNLGAPSLAFLGVTAFLMLFTIERTFNDIWRVREPRQGFQRFLMYWAVLSLGPILVGVGFAISTYIMSLPLITGMTDYTGALRYVPIFLSASMFTLMYVAVPNCAVSFKHAVVGGIIVAMAFEMAKYLFGFVMSRSSFELIYGAFAAVPLFLLWIYISWTIVLMGAELVKGLGVFRPDGGVTIEAPLFQIVIILEMFYRAHQLGEVVLEEDVRAQGARIDLERWNDYRQCLVELGLIRGVDKGGLVLAKDLSEVSLWDLYQLLPWPMPLQIKGDGPWERKLGEEIRHITDHNQTLLKTDLESLFRLKTKPQAAATSNNSPAVELAAP
ncbi:MAG: membrane protein [Candidatus Azotimanducaceae bacterium]|jgi:membrane protein